ncbi:occludin/ELL domain-containing protein 1 [Opisthocomus hoazin]|uniref:occludin/ELL domain-containing protein 1 n=1 Tax=Opisthocomus hoazin TaxID=30419 RepID=UPI003F535612
MEGGGVLGSWTPQLCAATAPCTPLPPRTWVMEGGGPGELDPPPLLCRGPLDPQVPPVSSDSGLETPPGPPLDPHPPNRAGGAPRKSPASDGEGGRLRARLRGSPRRGGKLRQAVRAGDTAPRVIALRGLPPFPLTAGLLPQRGSARRRGSGAAAGCDRGTPSTPRTPGADGPSPPVPPGSRGGWAPPARARRVAFEDAVMPPGRPPGRVPPTAEREKPRAGSVPPALAPRPHAVPDYLVRYPAIRSPRQREGYAAVFQDQRAEYAELLGELRAAWRGLGGPAVGPPPRHAASRTDRALPAKQQRCRYLKEKLTHVKARIREYDRDARDARDAHKTSDTCDACDTRDARDARNARDAHGARSARDTRDTRDAAVHL